MNQHPEPDDDVSLAQESQAFLLLAAVLVPVLTVISIAGYGFAVWISQLFLGPPGL